MSSYTLAILGCGTIGQALLSAYLAAPAEKTAPAKIIACVKSESSANKLKEQYASSPIPFEVSFGDDSNRNAVAQAKVVIIGTKPYLTEDALRSTQISCSEDKLLISMVAGWTIEQFSMYSLKVSRVMTNTPAKYGFGTAVVANSANIDDAERQLILDLVSPIGKVVELPEKHMDAATSLVGSGPAFVLLMLEGLIEGGLSMGIPFDESKECALKVLEGTAKMVELSGLHPGELKHKVCTPGGTTIAGLVEMEKNGVKSGIISGVKEAAVVAAKLGKK